MDIERVKDVLAQLARGVDPVTGEVFAQDSPYNHPEIIRALFIALEELQRIKMYGPPRYCKYKIQFNELELR